MVKRGQLQVQCNYKSNSRKRAQGPTYLPSLRQIMITKIMFKRKKTNAKQPKATDKSRVFAPL